MSLGFDSIPMLQRVDEMTLNDMHETVVLASCLSSPLIAYITVLAEVKEKETTYTYGGIVSLYQSITGEKGHLTQKPALFFFKNDLFFRFRVFTTKL